MTAQQILEQKGYDNSDCIDILQADPEISLDMKVREKYGLGDEALHLWEGYYLGDADEEKVKAVAEKHGFQDIDDLFKQMDADLNELAENYPEK